MPTCKAYDIIMEMNDAPRKWEKNWERSSSNFAMELRNCVNWHYLGRLLKRFFLFYQPKAFSKYMGSEN